MSESPPPRVTLRLTLYQVTLLALACEHLLQHTLGQVSESRRLARRQKHTLRYLVTLLHQCARALVRMNSREIHVRKESHE